MTAPSPAGDRPSPRPAVRDVLRLAWPAVVSYVLGNAYRINDQYWIQGLGGEAQAAVGATFFVVIMNFALLFLAGGGTLARVARAVGAGDSVGEGRVTRHALLLAGGLGLALTLVGVPLTPTIVDLLQLEGTVGEHARTYLGALYAVVLPLALVPALDHVFIGRGDTRTPMLLLALAISLNYGLNPVLIYGAEAATRVPGAPGAELLSALARGVGLERGYGLAGAAWATGLSRGLSLLVGLALLRFRDGISLAGSRRPKLEELVAIARISAPVSLSIATYASVYWALLALVLAELPTEVTGGLGLGFTVFEGLSFPCFLGISVAGASLVGRRLGARDPEGAWEAVRAARRVGRFVGAGWALVFLTVAPALVPLFTEDAGVARETVLYVTVLGFSQYWVAVESIHEKVLLGSGRTAPILWISGACNLLRIPLGHAFAIRMGWGAAGMWWAINLTTYAKAWLFWRAVQRRDWLRERA